MITNIEEDFKKAAANGNYYGMHTMDADCFAEIAKTVYNIKDEKQAIELMAKLDAGENVAFKIGDTKFARIMVPQPRNKERVSLLYKETVVSVKKDGKDVDAEEGRLVTEVFPNISGENIKFTYLTSHGLQVPLTFGVSKSLLAKYRFGDKLKTAADSNVVNAIFDSNKKKGTRKQKDPDISDGKVLWAKGKYIDIRYMNDKKSETTAPARLIIGPHPVNKNETSLWYVEKAEGFSAVTPENMKDLTWLQENGRIVKKVITINKDSNNVNKQKIQLKLYEPATEKVKVGKFFKKMTIPVDGEYSVSNKKLEVYGNPSNVYNFVVANYKSDKVVNYSTTVKKAIAISLATLAGIAALATGYTALPISHSDEAKVMSQGIITAALNNRKLSASTKAEDKGEFFAYKSTLSDAGVIEKTPVSATTQTQGILKDLYAVTQRDFGWYRAGAFLSGMKYVDESFSTYGSQLGILVSKELNKNGYPIMVKGDGTDVSANYLYPTFVGDGEESAKLDDENAFTAQLKEYGFTDKEVGTFVENYKESYLETAKAIRQEEIEKENDKTQQNGKDEEENLKKELEEKAEKEASKLDFEADSVKQAIAKKVSICEEKKVEAKDLENVYASNDEHVYFVKSVDGMYLYKIDYNKKAEYVVAKDENGKTLKDERGVTVYAKTVADSLVENINNTTNISKAFNAEYLFEGTNYEKRLSQITVNEGVDGVYFMAGENDNNTLVSPTTFTIRNDGTITEENKATVVANKVGDSAKMYGLAYFGGSDKEGLYTIYKNPNSLIAKFADNQLQKENVDELSK